MANFDYWVVTLKDTFESHISLISLSSYHHITNCLDDPGIGFGKYNCWKECNAVGSCLLIQS